MTSTNKSSIGGIILAGGESTRFQDEKEPWQDKALFVLNGQTMLEKMIKTHSEICDEIIIVVNNSDRKQTYQDICNNLPTELKQKIKIIKDDRTILSKGPTLGLLSGIKSSKSNCIIVTPVDMPNLTSSFLSQLQMKLEEHSLLVPYYPLTGKIEPLVLAINKLKIQNISKILEFVQESRADDLIRASLDTKFIAVKKEHLPLAKELFRSFNKKSDLQELNVEKVPIPGEIFDEKNSITSFFEQDDLLLKRVAHFLTESKFLQPDSVTLKFLDILSNALSKSNYFFLSGIILYEFLNYLTKNISLGLKKDHSIFTRLIENCFTAFMQESNYWKRMNINFLEFHAKLDAQDVLKRQQNIYSEKELASSISQLKDQMNLKKKGHKHTNFETDIIERKANFISKAKELINRSESEFNKEQPIYDTEFLWEHSLRVGRIAYYLAQREGTNPLIPTLGAILHDVGKFILGNYHTDNLPEEKHSATIAEQLLQEEGMSKEVISEIMKAISALYNDDFACDLNCQIIHDADRLDKLGALGIANFFTKSALRGATLQTSIIRNLGRELTYANAAPKTMYTKTGKALAKTRGKESITYFNNLLDELKLYDMGRFFVKKFLYEKKIELLLVIPEECQKCDGQYLLSFQSKEGIKCKQIVTTYTCNKCAVDFTISFCLPVLIDK